MKTLKLIRYSKMLVFFFNIFIPLTLKSQPINYILIYPGQTKEYGIRFSIGFTFGKHKGVAENASGKVLLDSINQNLLEAQFVVPIGSLKTGNRQRDCHLQEALGLDYEKSDYPEKNICDNSDTLPKIGANALVFKNIQFESSKIEIIERANDKTRAIVYGKWVIHGIEKNASLPIEIIKQDQDYQIIGKTQIKLSDFGISVRKVLFVTVKDGVDLELNLKLQKE